MTLCHNMICFCMLMLCRGDSRIILRFVCKMAFVDVGLAELSFRQIANRKNHFDEQCPQVNDKVEQNVTEQERHPLQPCDRRVDVVGIMDGVHDRYNSISTSTTADRYLV